MQEKHESPEMYHYALKSLKYMLKSSRYFESFELGVKNGGIQSVFFGCEMT